MPSRTRARTVTSGPTYTPVTDYSGHQGRERVREYSNPCIDMRADEVLISAESGVGRLSGHARSGIQITPARMAPEPIPRDGPVRSLPWSQFPVPRAICRIAIVSSVISYRIR